MHNKHSNANSWWWQRLYFLASNTSPCIKKKMEQSPKLSSQNMARLGFFKTCITLRHCQAVRQLLHLVTPKGREMEKLRKAFQIVQTSQASAQRAHATPRSSSIRLGAARHTGGSTSTLWFFRRRQVEVASISSSCCWPLLMALPWSATDFKLNRYRFDIQSESLPLDSRDLGCAAENGRRKNSKPAPKIP